MAFSAQTTETFRVLAHDFLNFVNLDRIFRVNGSSGFVTEVHGIIILTN